MLRQFGRRLAYKLRRKLNSKTLTLNGIQLTIDARSVPKGIRIQLLKKNYEEQELSLVTAALVPSDRVLEAGAGIGYIGIACAKICGQENIVSYEPNSTMKSVIEKNYALNGLVPNLRNKVLAVEPGEVEFFFSDSVLSSSLIDRKHGEATTVLADGMSDVVESFDPSAIVMDVEGAEIELLRNCSLEHVRKIVIEMHPHVVGGDKIEELCDYLVESGFSLSRQLGKVYLFQKS